MNWGATTICSLAFTGGRMHDGKRWRLVQQIREYEVGGREGGGLIRDLKWKETVSLLNRRWGSISFCTHTFLCRSRPFTFWRRADDGGRGHWGGVGWLVETSDAELIAVGVSWGWSVCSLAPPPGASCGKPWLYLKLEGRWDQVRWIWDSTFNSFRTHSRRWCNLYVNIFRKMVERF